MSISLCMIVKDEEQFLDSCLKSVKPYFNDIVVVDTGSKDRTKDISSENGARVFDFEWCDDFSAARNFAASQAYHDWIFVIDADEVIAEFDKAQIAEFIKNPYSCGSVTMFDESHMTYNDLTRLYNRLHYQYKGRIHEQICSTTPNDKAADILDIPVLLNHYGYSPEVLSSKKKLERNEEMLLRELAENPNDPYILYQLGKSKLPRAGQEKEACDYFEKALEQNPDLRLDYVYNLVECYGYALLNSDQNEKAFEVALDYFDNYRQKPEFRFLLGHIYQNNGKLVEAVEWYESCIGANEVDFTGISSFLAYYNIGVILECLGMSEDAACMYQNCGTYEAAEHRLKLLQDML